MRESKDITREELIYMVGTLRGMLYSYFDDLTMEEIKELNEDRLRVLSETAFGQSDCEGDVKTASEKIAELEEKLAAANAFIEKHKYIIAEKAARAFVNATKTLCEDITQIGTQMVDIMKRACDECPHRQSVPCETCKLVEEVKDTDDMEKLVRRGWFGGTMTAEEREEQRRSFAHGNVAMHNPNATRELIDQEAEKLKAASKDLEKDVTYWSCDDGEEQLSCTDPDEAVEEYLDDYLNPKMTPEEVLAVLPKEITVYGFARMKPFLLENESLDHLLEVLDEEYGDPDGGNTEPTEAMIEAEKKFHDVVISEYESWACKQVCTREVNVEEWVRKNRPDWLE